MKTKATCCIALILPLLISAKSVSPDFSRGKLSPTSFFYPNSNSRKPTKSDKDRWLIRNFGQAGQHKQLSWLTPTMPARVDIDDQFYTTTYFTDNVVIGTVSVPAILEVNANTNARIRLTSTSGSNPSLSFIDYAGSIQHGVIQAYDLAINNGSTDLFKILSNGNVGIGTSSPTVLLDVRGDTKVGGNFSVGNQGGNDITYIGGGSGVGSTILNYYANGVINNRLIGNGDNYLNNAMGGTAIGKNTVGSGYKLDVAGNIRSNALSLADNMIISSTALLGANHKTIFQGNVSGTNDEVLFDMNKAGGAYGYFQYKSEDTARLFVSGNKLSGGSYVIPPYGTGFGIGTSSPAGNFDARGQMSYFGTNGADNIITLRGYNGGESAIFSNSGSSGNYNGLRLTSNTNNTGGLGSWTIDIGGSDAIHYYNTNTISFRNNSTEIMRINNDGVEIGTRDSVNSSKLYKLAVRGDITAKKIVVKATGWSDYVFEEGYRLRKLDILEDFITLNKHLPEVPTAAEVEKNGISVGDTQALLLKKIEELTLYLIELNKKVSLQDSEISALKKELKH